MALVFPAPGNQSHLPDKPGLNENETYTHDGSVYNTIKKQLEAGLGKALELDPEYAGDPVNRNEYTQTMHSTKSANRRPYWIILPRSRTANTITLEFEELQKDP